jgi:hypothetical protein
MYTQYAPGNQRWGGNPWKSSILESVSMGKSLVDFVFAMIPRGCTLQAIRDNWALAMECQLPAALLTCLARVITVVDATRCGYGSFEPMDLMGTWGGRSIKKKKINASKKI